MKDKIIELIDEFEERLKSLKEEYNDEELTYELGDKYWVVGGNGEPGPEQWNDHFYDKKALENNAIFKTQEEAEFEAEKRKILHELKQLGRPFRPNKCNYGICLHHDSPDNQKELFYKSATEVEQIYGDYYFDSIPKAKDAVYRIGEERIMKYLFRAED